MKITKKSVGRSGFRWLRRHRHIDKRGRVLWDRDPMEVLSLGLRAFRASPLPKQHPHHTAGVTFTKYPPLS